VALDGNLAMMRLHNRLADAQPSPVPVTLRAAASDLRGRTDQKCAGHRRRDADAVSATRSTASRAALSIVKSLAPFLVSATGAPRGRPRLVVPAAGELDALSSRLVSTWPQMLAVAVHDHRVATS